MLFSNFLLKLSQGSTSMW